MWNASVLAVPNHLTMLTVRLVPFRICRQDMWIEILDESWIIFSNSEKFLSGRHDGTLCDYSWLTGISGIVWANAILRREPLLNPFVPWDSLLYNTRELSKERL